MRSKSTSVKIWDFFDNLKGDKVVWMIVLLLMMYSVVSLFSASSCEPKVIRGEWSRIVAMKKELEVILVGLGVVILAYQFKTLRFFKLIGRFSFLISIAMLLFLSLGDKADLGLIKAGSINGAYRVIVVAGFQVHIFELIKVLMVLYIAYMVEAYKKKDIWLVKKLSHRKHFAFLKEELAQRAVFLYLPMLLVVILIAPKGFSSSGIIAGTLLLMLFMGGTKKILGLTLGLLLVLGSFYSLWKITNWSALSRIETVENRIKGLKPLEEKFLATRKYSVEYYDALSKIMQPEAALVAIKDSGIGAKGPGKSVQKYQVSMMFEDYMFSLLVEEYGSILGGVAIMLLYLSLLARGAIIARNCNDLFAKLTVAGLSLLITLQAFVHITVNLGIGPITGQTLPLISHGKSAYLTFCAAFGIILSISRMATKRIEKEMKYMNAEDPILERPENDSIQSEMNTLDMLDSEEEMGVEL